MIMAGPPPSAGVHPVLRLVRVGNVGVSFVGTIVGGLVARGSGFAGPLEADGFLLLAAISTSCVTAGGNVINDILDQSSDRVNHPTRPLVTGAVRARAARRLAAVLLILSAVLIVPLIPAAPLVPVILAAAVGSLLLYEFRFKSAGFSGNLLVAFLTAAVFLYGGATAGNVLVTVPLAAMAFGATLSREVIKDMEDAEGDIERRTLPRTKGLAVSSAVARVCVGGAIALSPVPLLWLVAPFSPVGIIYLALVAAADALFVVSVLWLPRRLHQEQSLSKGAMTVALIAFLALAFR